MTTIRNFCCNDLLRLSSVNLDQLSYTTTMNLYMNWLSKFPNYSHVAIAPGNQMMGYLLGALKMEENLDEDYWHGLTILLHVASDYRRQKLGTTLMRLFETQMVERRHSIITGSTRFPLRHYLQKSSDTGVVPNYYMYLYIGVFNILAQRFYTKIGYRYVTTLSNYYFKKNEFDALEMAKEINEKTLSRVEQEIGVCSICDEDKSANCSYVCLPRIYCICDEAY